MKTAGTARCDSTPAGQSRNRTRKWYSLRRRRHDAGMRLMMFVCHIKRPDVAKKSVRRQLGSCWIKVCVLGESCAARREQLQCFLWQHRHHRSCTAALRFIDDTKLVIKLDRSTRRQRVFIIVMRWSVTIVDVSMLKRVSSLYGHSDLFSRNSETDGSSSESQSSPPSSAGDDRNVFSVASYTSKLLLH